MNQISQLKFHAYKFLDELTNQTGSVPDRFQVIDWPLTVYSLEAWLQLIKEGYVISAVAHRGFIDATFYGDKVWNYSSVSDTNINLKEEN